MSTQPNANDSPLNTDPQRMLQQELKFAIIWTVVCSMIIVPNIVLTSISASLPCDEPLTLFMFVYSGLFTYGFIFEKWVLFFVQSRRDAARNNACIIVPLIFSCQISKFILIIWYFSGSLWFWTSKTCKFTNPILYWTTFSNFIISYMAVFMPLILFCCIMACGGRFLPRNSHTSTNIWTDTFFPARSTGLSPM